MKSPKTFSVVIPVFNESEIFSELCERVDKASREAGHDYEIIFVDDGSTDHTLDLIKSQANQNQKIKYLSFSRNFGHQVAVSAGIEQASKDAVIVMDGDLQDPPELIPEFLKKWEEGWEVVYAIRKKRQENAFLKFCYFSFYRMLEHTADIAIPPDSGDFCLMDRRVVDVLKHMPEKNRYVRGIRAWAGFRQTGLPYDRPKRQGGSTKYSFWKLTKLAIDGLTSFSTFPLRLCGYLGLGMAVISVFGLLYSVISKVFFEYTPRGWTSTTIAVFFIGGVQLVMLSVVGSYVARIYTEVQNRPLYVVKDSNLKHQPQP